MVSSSTVSTERHFFRSRVMQRELSGDYLGQPLQTKFEEDGMDPIPMVPIRVRLFKQIRSRSRFWIGDGTEPILVVEKVINCNLPFIQSQMEQYSGFTMAKKISEIGVPLDELPAIIRKLYRVVKVAVPCVPISVIIVDVTVHISMGVVAPVTMTIGNLLDVEIIDWDTWESLETLVQSPKFIPASRSSIEGLEQTKLYSFEATVRQTECAICKEGLDQFGLEEEEKEEEEEEEEVDHQSMITCLPCSHLFHTDCIVKWLTTRTCHLCPICRNRMPTEHVSEPPQLPEGGTEHVSEPPQLPEGGIHWPMLLVSSAGYVITIALVCRLLKQT